MAYTNPFAWLLQAVQNATQAGLNLGPGISNAYNPGIENGVDLPLHYHTAITSLTPGIVEGITSQFGGGGVISILTNINYGGINGPAEIYYQHLSDIAPNILADFKKGIKTKIGIGDLIGYSGGQVGYGDNPSSTKFSNGPHIEIGFNPNPNEAIKSIWNPLGLGPQINPTQFIEDAIAASQTMQNGGISTTLALAQSKFAQDLGSPIGNISANVNVSQTSSNDWGTFWGALWNGIVTGIQMNTGTTQTQLQQDNNFWNIFSNAFKLGFNESISGNTFKIAASEIWSFVSDKFIRLGLIISGVIIIIIGIITIAAQSKQGQESINLVKNNSELLS